MNVEKNKTINKIVYILLGIVIDIVITYPMWFISIYMNPKTYHGNEGHNDGLIVLCLTLPILILISRAYKKRNNLNAYYASVVIIVIHVILFSVLAYVGI